MLTTEIVLQMSLNLEHIIQRTIAFQKTNAITAGEAKCFLQTMKIKQEVIVNSRNLNRNKDPIETRNRRVIKQFEVLKTEDVQPVETLQELQ